MSNTAVTLNSSLHFIGFISNKQPSRKRIKYSQLTFLKTSDTFTFVRVVSHSDYMFMTGGPGDAGEVAAEFVAIKNWCFNPKHGSFSNPAQVILVPFS